ncbi:MAG: hypothetical protein IKX40_07105 [Thermoguttaceae bacterium]|nr:hypothetical protein [Thermoguttaceae bacterium]
MTESRLYHGYFVFRSIIKNNDAVPHKVVLSCPNVAAKNYELRPGETINASLPLPVTNPDFGDSIQVTVDNKKLDPIPCPMRKSWRSHYLTARSFGSHSYDPEIMECNSFLVCRSLRSQLAEMEAIFAEADCKQWPQDRLDYSCLDVILLTPAELSAAPDGVQTALREFVLAGGVLWLFDCENQKDDLDKIEWIVQLKEETSPNAMKEYNQFQCLEYPVAFGRVVLSNFTPEKFRSLYLSNKSNKNIIIDIYQCFDFQFSSRIIWFDKQDLNEWHRSFPIANDLSIPVLGIGFVIFLFVMLAGPVNLFLLTKYNKRIWLLVTVPALSFLFASAILLYVILSEGFKTDTRIAVGSYLDQRNGMYSSMIQYAFYARTTPRNVVFDSNDELNIMDDNNDNARLSIDWTSGKQIIHSHFVPVRKPAYYKVRKTGTTRLKLDFDFNAENPYVVNGLGKDVDQLFVRSEDGSLWRAESVKAGQKAQLTSVNQYFDEANKKQPFAYPACIASSTWNFSKSSVSNLSKTLPPQCYIVTFDSPGPFTNKGISYAKEKESFGFLMGRF